MNKNESCSCSCCGEHEHNNSKSIYKRLLSALGVLCFVSAFFVRTESVTDTILFLSAFLLIGWEVLLISFKNILKGKVFDENFLMSIASISAFIIGEEPEAVAVMLFYKIGMYFEDLAVDKSKDSIEDLMKIRPDFAFVKKDGAFVKVMPETVIVGDIILVKAGEKIPLDGSVIDGVSSIDMSALSGESLPQDVSAGSFVLSGAINISSILTIKVEKLFKESTVSKILNLVAESSENKSKTENFITKFSKYYTPIVVALAVLLALIPPLITGASFEVWIGRALIFLVMSCPCALVISIPLTYFASIGGASKQGILVKGANYMEALSKVSDVVFDKTGTLTKGKFKVLSVKAQNNFSKDELLKNAAYCEYYNLHPIALSIKEAYKEQIDEGKIKDYKEYAGLGIIAKIDGKDIAVGNASLLKQFSINAQQASSAAAIVYIAIDGAYAGFIEIADEIKSDARQTIEYLRKSNIKTSMLTGDVNAIAQETAQYLQIDDFHSGLLPHQKAQKLQEIKENASGVLVFMGDGINDAPVLAGADIGIAMGALGSDAAIEAADIVFMTDEPSKIISALKIAKNTKKIVSQNIIFILSIKAIVLVLGALGMAQLWFAVFADVGVALIAVLNSMRAMKK
ncbi:MAG: cadmium-translocating P-type ATPase [Endomicrobium sp.]|jgi:Cd2+/Zn2+-exporting ATPase|nr:cadmium-translocating P-type ATPase [Endomicrobium sp.]